MYKQSIAFFFMSFMLVACAVKPPTLLPNSTTPPAATAIPTHSPAKTIKSTPAPTLTKTSEPTITSTADVNLDLERVAQIGGTINGITVLGDLAYVGQGPRLAVIDISQHENPRFISQSEPLPGLLTQLIQITHDTHQLLLVSAGKYLVVLDISKPEHIFPVSQLELSGGITAMVWDDWNNILYAGGMIYQRPSVYTGFISAVEIGLDNQLQIINTVAMPETPLSLALGESSLFAGANGDKGGLYYIQLSIPGDLSTPRQVIASTPEVPLAPISMQVIGDRLYLSYWGIEAYDITNPDQPVKVWTGYVEGCNIVNDFSVQGDQFFGIGFLIREPDIPIRGMLTSPDRVNDSQLGQRGSITALHDGGFIVADQNLEIYSTADPQGMQLEGSYLPPVANAVDAVANENAIYVVDIGVGDGLGKAFLWELSLPDLIPTWQVTTEISNSHWNGFSAIALDGDRVYIASQDSVWVYGVGNSEPNQLGKVEIAGGQIEAIVAFKQGEKRLLVAAQATDPYINTLRVYDLTDLQNTTALGDALTLAEGFEMHMIRDGSEIYVLLVYTRYSSPNIGILYDIDYDNNLLSVKGSLELSGYIGHLTASESIIALAGPDILMSQSVGSMVKPDPLKLLSQNALPGNAVGLAINGDMAWVVVGGYSSGEAQLLAYDVHDPANPVQVEELDIALSENNAVTVLGIESYLILANGSGGVEAFQYGR